jgi:hypothetical protein
LGWAESPTVLQVGELYHIVGVYSGGVMRLYVNGVLKGEDLQAGIPLPVDNQYGLYIGRGIGSSFEFAGRVDEVALYDHVLTGQRIQQHYNAGN